MALHPGFRGILLAELGLLGEFVQLSESLYSLRIHANQPIHPYRSLKFHYRWVNPVRHEPLPWPRLRYGRLFALAAPRSAPDLRTRPGCLWRRFRWCAGYRGDVRDDLKEAMR